MAVVRKLDLSNYAVDAAGAPVGDGKRAMGLGVAKRVYPIDRYDVPGQLETSARVARLRILKVPLLGQAGYKGNWCGRTSMSMAYNWFVLLKGADPKAEYITHWEPEPARKHNLRLPNKARAFTHPLERAPLPAESLGHGYGGFSELVNDTFGKKYSTITEKTPAFPTLLPYSPVGAAARAAEASKLGEAQVQARFAPVLDAIDRNNPVFMYSGLTKGCNHLILLVGYVLLLERGVPTLFIAVADPATERWLGSDGPGSRLCDLSTGKGSVDDVGPEHDVVLLVDGDWNERRATLSLVRASFFFQKKADLDTFRKKSGNGDFSKYQAAHALVMDDVGNPRPGGTLLYSLDDKHREVPEGAVLTRPVGLRLPLDVPGLTRAPLPTFWSLESRDPQAGGGYPLGLGDHLHGGVHLPTEPSRGGGDSTLVRAFAPGRVVAARLRLCLPTSEDVDGRPRDDVKKEADAARQVVGNDTELVLLRHVLEVLPKPSEAAVASVPSKRVVLYSLAMHLTSPEGAPRTGLFAQVGWLESLLRARHGSLHVVDPSPAPQSFALDQRPTDLPLGARLSPAKESTAPLMEGEVALGASSPEAPRRLGVEKAADGRVRVVGLAPPEGLLALLRDMSDGKLGTFSSPRAGLAVEAGTPIGVAKRRSKLGGGFVHWEVLAPADVDGGLGPLLDALAEEGLPELVRLDETKADNLLGDDEEKALFATLPDEDRDRELDPRRLSSLSFAAPLEGGPALGPDEYHLELSLGFYEGVAPEGPVTVEVMFEGAQGREPGAPLSVSSSGVHVLAVPAWATKIHFRAAGLRARELSLDVPPEALAAHAKRVVSRRFRNLVLRHVNEWSLASMKQVLGVRYYFKGSEKEALEALAFWGADEAPAPGSKKLFGGLLPAKTMLDDVHPVTATWLLDALVRRGRVRFVEEPPEVPPAAEKAGFLPVLKEHPKAMAGSPVSAFVLADGEGPVEVGVTAKSADGKVRVELGRTAYEAQLAALHRELSGWGTFELEVRHYERTAKGEEAKVVSPELVGASSITLEKPALEALTLGPARLSDDEHLWQVDLASAGITYLEAYVVAYARPRPASGPGGALALQPLALPVVARAAGPELGTYEAGLLTGPPKQGDKVLARAELVPSVALDELVKAGWGGQGGPGGKGGAPKVARRLLVALSALDALAEEREPGSDLDLVAGGLSEDGTRARVRARKTRAGVVTDEVLVELARSLGLEATLVSPEPEAAKPGKKGKRELPYVELGLAGAPAPSSLMVVSFDPRHLYGKVLEGMKPEGPIEVQLALRFYNGGHVFPSPVSVEADPTSGEGGEAEAFVCDALGEREHLELCARGVQKVLAKPKFEAISVAPSKRGVRVTVRALGGDDTFWKRAKPVVRGVTGEKDSAEAPLSGAVTRDGRLLSAQLAFPANAKKLSLVATLGASAEHGGALFEPKAVELTHDVDLSPRIAVQEATPVGKNLVVEARVVGRCLGAEVRAVAKAGGETLTLGVFRVRAPAQSESGASDDELEEPYAGRVTVTVALAKLRKLGAEGVLELASDGVSGQASYKLA
jgi:hypothetical protein